MSELTALSQAGKDQQVKEVHDAEREQHDAHFPAQDFEHTLRTINRLSSLEVERDEADVDEVKAHDEQVIHTVREFRVALEALDQKDPPVFVQCSGDPDGHGNGQDEVKGIGGDGSIHRY